MYCDFTIPADECLFLSLGVLVSVIRNVYYTVDSYRPPAGGGKRNRPAQ
jgi:hypothetical protein